LVTAAAMAVISVVCAAGAWWFGAAGDTQGLARTPEPDPAALALASPHDQGTTDGASAAWAGHRPNAAAGDPFLTRGLRQTLEEMLLEATAGGDIGDPASLKKRLAALLPRYFPAEHAARAAALAERYVDYRVALGALKPPADPNDPRALRAALEARQQVRERYFNTEEYGALFAQEAQLDRFTLARIEIERHSGLSPAQKQAALQDAERELSDEQRAQRANAVAHVAVAAQTAVFDAQGTSDSERYAQRRAQHGDAAAQQLAQLDREERDWQARLNDYAGAKASHASPEQLQQLRQQLFSAQEQLRIEAALAARPQPAAVQP
jgi:lipase chaperone LimK